MASCLGLYIENNLIKYAKVSKNNDAVKVESLGIKFYENLESTIKQIVEETYSFKTPISINLTEETYNKFEVFSLLSKKDIDGVVKTEFENICYDKGINKNIFEQRYIFSNSTNKSEKIKVIHISVPKTTIAQRKNQLSAYRINSILPIGVTISNLINTKGTVLIVNIEANTTITKISKNGIIDITTISLGTKEILEKIKQKENSYTKAYEICKNTTIYTETAKDLQYEENEYLEDIMPTLFNIATEVRKITEESFENIQNVYITGTGSVINNIDIYFQEYLKNVNCEILKPSFISNNSKINIKDYIEVNSAISLALQGLNKNNEINFTQSEIWEKLFNILKSDVSIGNVNLTVKDLDNFLTKFSKQYNILFFSVSSFLIIYIMTILIINGQLNRKMNKTMNSINLTNNRISTIQNYNNKFNQQVTRYKKLISDIEDANASNSEDKRYKNTIPNLLNRIMVVIPKEVQVTSIENTSDTHIVIKVQSSKYEQIAYFKTKLKKDEILKNVVSDTGTAQAGNIVVTIEGELP